MYILKDVPQKRDLKAWPKKRDYSKWLRVTQIFLTDGGWGIENKISEIQCCLKYIHHENVIKLYFFFQTDLVTKEELTKVTAMVRKINPNAKIMHTL